MLEHVVAVPFHYHPVELLPPAPRDGESARTGPAERRHRRRLLEVTLQIPVRAQFGELVRHQSRMITVRSEPGMVCPTDSTDRVNCAPDGSGASVLPSTGIKVVAHGSNISRQYGVPSRFTC